MCDRPPINTLRVESLPHIRFNTKFLFNLSFFMYGAMFLFSIFLSFVCRSGMSIESFTLNHNHNQMQIAFIGSVSWYLYAFSISPYTFCTYSICFVVGNRCWELVLPFGLVHHEKLFTVLLECDADSYSTCFVVIFLLLFLKREKERKKAPDSTRY